MPLMDEFREERQALKNGTFKEKIRYFWDYYKWHTIGIIVAIICIVSLVRTIVNNKDIVLNAALLNCAQLATDTDQLCREYAEYAGIDLKEYDILLDTNYHISSPSSYDQSTVNTMQKLVVNMAVGDLDVMMGSDETFEHYAYMASFLDLRELLGKEQLGEYKPYFYYVDMSVVNEMEQMRSELQDTDDVPIPDPRNPEEMDDPVPVALYIPSDKLRDYYYFENMDSDLALGVLINSSQKDNALAFIEFLMQP